ncbi:GTP cyclohydrolase 1, partial [Pseudomonas syringae pv. coriandricola]
MCVSAKGSPSHLSKPTRKHSPVTLEQNYTAILGQLGEDVSREGLLDTPKRAAKAMQYLCRG